MSSMCNNFRYKNHFLAMLEIKQFTPVQAKSKALFFCIHKFQGRSVDLSQGSFTRGDSLVALASEEVESGQFYCL